MSVRAQLPDLEHWKAQVKCQAGCPVRTDAGRYVQLIAEGRDEEAFLVARAPNPFASVCGRVCAAPCEDACRRGNIDAPISIRALKRYVTEQYGVESRRPDTQDRLREQPILEGNLYRGHLPVVPLSGQSRGPRRKVAVVGAGPAGPLRRTRPRAPRLRGHGLRRLRGAGRDDALRHPRVPAAALAHPRGDPEDPVPRGHLAIGGRPDRVLRPRRAPARRLRVRLHLRRRLARAGTCRSRASSSMAW